LCSYPLCSFLSALCCAVLSHFLLSMSTKLGSFSLSTLLLCFAYTCLHVYLSINSCAASLRTCSSPPTSGMSSSWAWYINSLSTLFCQTTTTFHPNHHQHLTSTAQSRFLQTQGLDVELDVLDTLLDLKGRPEAVLQCPRVSATLFASAKLCQAYKLPTFGLDLFLRNASSGVTELSRHPFHSSRSDVLRPRRDVQGSAQHHVLCRAAHQGRAASSPQLASCHEFAAVASQPISQLKSASQVASQAAHL
jgi:hypothetical protein